MSWQEKAKELMKQQGINQKQLSELSGISESSLSRYLQGNKSVRTDILINIAKALNVSFDYLSETGDDDEEDPFTAISTVIARKGNELTPEEKNRLISIILSGGD